MSQPNEINFGPVFMRGRKPAPVTNKSNPMSNNPPGTTQTLFSQPHNPTNGPPSTIIKSNQHHPPASMSPANNLNHLPLPKSFSAAVSPGKEIEDRPHHNGLQNACDSEDFDPSSDPPSPHISPAADYSREALLNLYSEEVASKLPPDLEINDPAVSIEFVGPPLALIEMAEPEKELFAGHFNSEKRTGVNKPPAHHYSQDHSLGITLSPETAVNNSLPGNKLSVGGAVKLGKNNSTERFNSLGIQGGVLAGVASTHSNPRRRGDSELDSLETPRRVQRPEDTSGNASPWSANLRDRRARDSGPPADGKWKRGVSFEEKIQPQESVGGSNLKYSVLDKMREKAAANQQISSKETHQSSATANQKSHKSEAGNQLPLHASNQSAPKIDETATHSSTTKNESATPTDSFNLSESTTPSDRLAGSEPSPTQQSSKDLNPEDIAWQYRDPSGTVQGPFTAFQMQEWYKATFFREDLLVKRVIDAAFETMETLILRVGDRDRPFLARPPPALPPNLPLPHGFAHNHQIHTSQPSPQLSNSNVLDQVSIQVSRTDSSSVLGSSLTANSNTASNQLGGIPAVDPWNNIAPVASPLPRPTTLPASNSMDAGIAWNSALPPFADYEINDGILEFNPSLLNTPLLPNRPNSFVPPETLRFLQQMQHPVLSMAPANGYHFPLPLAQHPNFGQIPSMPPIVNTPGMDQILAAQLHSRLMHSPYLFNQAVANGVDGLEQHVDRPTHDNVAPPVNHIDPWQLPPQIPNDPQASDQNSLQSARMTPNYNHSALPSIPMDMDMGITHRVASANMIPATRSSGKFASNLESHERDADVNSQQVSAGNSQQVSAFNPQQDSTAFSATESPARASPPPSKRFSSTEKESSITAVENLAPTTSVPSESAPSSKPASTPGISTNPDPVNCWQNVSYQAATQSSSVTQATGPLAPASSVSKPTGKLVVLSKAQQDEQDRRTASIQKTQLQLKEAQAVERAAREASEAAAAAVSASFNTPAPWSKEEKPSPNLSLTEIQAIEAKQAEKRRLAEKQAAANRAMAERAMVAERASKASKEALPPTSNWAATASSPVKSSAPGTVWKPKESESPTITTGLKQSMKQIQEEEARKKNLALQQASKSASLNASKTVGGYAGTVASAKPAVGGPWSVVGAKSKIIGPPVTTTPSAVVGGVAAGPASTRVGIPTGVPSKPTPKTPVTISKITSKPSQTVPVASATNNNSSTATANTPNTDGPHPASPEFMKWLREALRGMNNVEDFVKMLLDFPINPDESVLEIVSDSVYAGSATLDGRRFAKEFNARRMADVAGRLTKGGVGGMAKMDAGLANGAHHNTKKSGALNHPPLASTMADAVRFQPAPKNDGWGFAVVGAKKKKK